MSIVYTETKTGLFDKKVVQGLYTAELETPNVNWMNGGKSFTLATLSTSGFKDHTRNKGFNAGTYENGKEVYTMGQDRDVEFYVDSQDVDETNQELSVGNISKTFLDEHATPEVDAYRFSKLANEAGTKAVDASITAANAYSKLKDGIKAVRKYGPQNIVGYVSSNVMDALERSTEFTRSITNQNVGQTALESRVTSLDGVKLIEVVEDERFYAAYDFSDGFTPAENAPEINYLFVAKPAVIAKIKEAYVAMFNPGEHTQGDGYLYQNRMYHDLFVLQQQVSGVSVSTTASLTTETTEQGA